ncbi:ATP-binding cassette sub-family A member 3-like [Trichechus manatus latirostris]|uniref:ATP-binding cassette sub-family A member 3-like n=1 Tax=Trichechus manatus latirostris TaxID=127582 RepID=A0A2Y9DFK7_TRIMA|nr:ATP-binding cassette sub-family A member 3-like [Trichechus manatus latirostris]
MDSLAFNQFAVLLWKNVTLKRRQFVNLVLEISLVLLFGMMLLISRAVFKLKGSGPYNYTSQSISTLPSFLENPDVWELIYVPSDVAVVKEISENVKRNLNTSIKVRGFSSETDFENYVKYDDSSDKVLAAIVFEDFKNSGDPLPLQVKYHLRFSRIQRTVKWPDVVGWQTTLLFANRPSLGYRNPKQSDGGSPGYIREGFLAVQHALDKAIMLYHESIAGQKVFENISIFVQRFPHPASSFDGLLWISSPLLPLMFILMFSPSILSILRLIVWEKENGLKEYQLIIGLRNWIIWAAYFFTFLLSHIVIISLICVLFFTKASVIDKPVFYYSDYSSIFVFFMCYAIASILFGFMVSTFFSKANLAASLGSFLFFAAFLPFNFIIEIYGEITLAKKIASCLSLNVALALGINLLLKLEMKEIGVKWDNLWTQAVPDDNLVFGYMLGMLLFDAFLYGLVTWYIETVFPGPYGMPQPWYFFLMRSYWFGSPGIGQERKERTRCETTEDNYFEAEPTDLVAGIQVKHLYKEYRDKVAVNDLSWNLYQGQITVLLGHNGAGKTTALSILTGLYPPTRGKAYINGFDISKNMAQIRKSLGFCPQHDLLFNDLTLSEHLFFYCVVKGVPRKMHPMEIDHFVSAFNLLEKYDEFSQSLSEGMKRKLSIIIALIGGSKVVILDEPSSGMDPVSRRVTWDLLQKYKQSRTILLSTHCMDEADVLGDRIAVMVRGTLQCCGSSAFLKQRYGAGYHIVMEKKPHCDVEGITALIDSHIPDASLDNNTVTTLSFFLHKEHTQRFVALCNDLEEKQEELGIARYGASITTMEEVFLKVNKLADSQMDGQALQSPSLKDQNKRHDKDKNVDVPSNYKRSTSAAPNEFATIKFNTGFPLYCQQFHSMLVKRALFSWRNWRLMLIQILVIVFVTAYLSKNLKKDKKVSSREIDLGHYGRTIVPYSISGNSSLALNIIKNLEIFLKSKNQELREVQGNVTNYILKSKECRNFCMIAFSITIEQDKTAVTILFNNEAYHSAPTSLAVLDNILFMSLSGPNASITITNKPQPFPLYNINIVPTSGMQVALSLSFGMAVLASSFCLQTMTEKITKVKQIQFVSGVYILTYWLSALLWDLICYSIPCCLILGVFRFLRVDALVMDYHFLDTMMIFMLYGWSVVPLIYLGSFVFSSSTVAYVKLTLFNYLTSLIGVLIHTVLLHYARDLPISTKTTIFNFLMMFPSYNFAICISKFFDNYEVKKQCSRKFQVGFLDCKKALSKNSIYTFEEDGIAKFLITLAAMGLFYLLLILFLDSSFWKLKVLIFNKIIPNVSKIFKKSNKAVVSGRVIEESEDEDIRNERKKVLALSQPKLQNTALILKKLTKIYFKCPVIKAVRNISLVVEKFECFGLLGLNGAGKTTIFKMLIGEESITSGVALIDGINITGNARQIRSRISYCPQSDAMLNYMTGRELLSMYARLWGVPEPDIYEYVEAFLHSMHLETHADKLIYTYSGGYKRRLSTAVALMGRPSVIFLDQPSTGMDPVAQNLIRDTVTQICKTGKAIIISSHSVEECEALCTRLAIMVKGRFTCLGSPQHLKNKFCNVYALKAKVNMDTEKNKLKEFKEFIARTFPGNIINQEHQGIIHYYIPKKDICWGKVFSILEDAKLLFNLEDYSVSQITLEQIFLTFANIDKMEEDHEIKLL